jgi:RNA polymerase sigma-70 factor (ECF subfamily)
MVDYSRLTDQELIAFLKEGRQLAFAEIYNRYKSHLLLHAYRMLQDGEEAKDLVQELFAIIWAKREELKISGSLDAYLYGAIKNRILNYVAHQKVIAKYTESLDNYIQHGTPANDEKMIEKELMVMIENEIAQLPARMREIFELNRREGMSYKQIAEKLKISENTVKVQLHNATKTLRTKINTNILFALLF